MAMTEKDSILAQLDWARENLGEVYRMLGKLNERLEHTDIRAGSSKASTLGKSPGATVPSAEPTCASKSPFEKSLCEESSDDPYEDVDKGEG